MSASDGAQIVNRAIHPVCRKVLMMIWEVCPADWLILQQPNAQAGPCNSHGKALRQTGQIISLYQAGLLLGEEVVLSIF